MFKYEDISHGEEVSQIIRQQKYIRIRQSTDMNKPISS